MSEIAPKQAAVKVKTFRQQLRKAVSDEVRKTMKPGADKGVKLITMMSSVGQKVWGARGTRLKFKANSGKTAKTSGFKTKIPLIAGFKQKWARGVPGQGGRLEVEYYAGGLASLIENGEPTSRMWNPRFRAGSKGRRNKGKAGHYMSGVKIPIRPHKFLDREWQANRAKLAPAVERALEAFRKGIGL